MPSIKEINKIIEMTPHHHSILLEGIHGCGKSEVIKSHFEKGIKVRNPDGTFKKDDSGNFILKQYRVQVLFLGQMADAGDLIGLPYQTKPDENGVIQTDFAPPKWWPTNKDEHFILFLDELNRGKPECMQCIMDMVLNRRLNGRDLPDNCMVISAINPLSDDGFYKVDDLDPALLDRFVRYKFEPTHDEWLDWGMRVGLNKDIIGFIGKNKDQLDPDTDSSAKANDIQPSRRSWERVAEKLDLNPWLVKDEEMMILTLAGDVGSTAISRFRSYIRDISKSLSANQVIMKWNKEIEDKIKNYELQDKLWMNRQIAFWFQEYEKEIKASKKMASESMKGLAKYLKSIGNEPMAQFLNILANDNFEQKTYAKTILQMNPDLAEDYFNVLHGKEEEEVEQQEAQLPE